MNIQHYLSQHYRMHPSMQPQDIVKLCYQAAFGAEHLLSDSDRARTFFMEEYEPLEACPGKLFETISPSFARISLTAWKGMGLLPEWLFQMFLLTASEASVRGKELFPEYLSAAGRMIEDGTLPITAGEWQEYLRHYLENGQGPVHHSGPYRQAERPAYRVVHRRFLKLLPVLTQLAGKAPGSKADKSAAFVLAIDGRAASGKTTLADQLAFILDGGIIHMDDFFLPPSLRTEQRFLTPGGNIHHERFQNEVIPFLHSSAPFSYRRFDCSIMDFGERRPVKGSAWRIVEGSYASHPVLGNYSDITVFSHIEPQEQTARILSRDGAEMAEIFKTKWIPMEEEYFTAYSIRENAHIILPADTPEK